MNLNSFAAEVRKRLFEDLELGKVPREGEYSEAVLKEGRSKGKPQMGTTRYLDNAIVFEFIYPDSKGAATLLAVTVSSPEPIVFMPVPEWVVEQIWQGEVTGSHHFLSHALTMLDNYRSRLAS